MAASIYTCICNELLSATVGDTPAVKIDPILHFWKLAGASLQLSQLK